MSNSDVDAFLAHHGIKGMKWGVRKERPGPMGARTISKGTQFQTVSAGAGVNTNRRVFSSYTEKDKLAYRGTYARNLKAIANTNDVRVNTYTLKKDIKVAGEEDALKVFKDMYAKDPKGTINAMAESYEAAVRAMFLGSATKDQSVIDAKASEFSKKGEKWINTKGYGVFNVGAGQARTANSIFDSYYSELGRRGFDAMIDVTDKSAKLGDDPIILLKPKQSIGKIKSVPLTEADITLARKAYKQQKKINKKTGVNGVVQ